MKKLTISEEGDEMPATSDRQRKLMAIAEHDPTAVFPENKGVTKMSHSQLHDFAATKGKLPEKAKAPKRGYGSEKRSDHGRHKRGRGDTMA